MTKLLFIGIDSADSQLIARFEEDLPNMRKLKQSCREVKIESVFPPDSDTAWSTIYTGLNPACHGVVDFVDPLNKAMKIQHVEKDNTKITGKTFWDLAGEQGKKVCLINPHLGFPVWKVNGIMVGRSSVEDRIDTYPENLTERYPELKNLIPWKGFPGNKESLKKYAESYKTLVKNETDIGLKLMKDFEWDMFFIYSSALDAIQHYFWDYCIGDDKAPVKQSEFRNIIKDFYLLYDEMVGKLVAQAGPGVTVIVASDHGHGMRPLRLLNVNEYLRRNEFLQVKQKRSNRTAFAVERSKRTLLDIVEKFRLENLASRMLKYFPAGKKIYTTPMSIDWPNTRAYISDLSGIKSYSYGGILIRREGLDQTAYEDLRERIIRGISGIEDPDTGKKVIRWICKREDLYTGSYIDRYPDIVFDMVYGYGAGWQTECDLFGASRTHNFVPGSHRGETPILFIRSPDLDKTVEIRSLEDIYHQVLRYLDSPDDPVQGSRTGDGHLSAVDSERSICEKPV